VGYFITLSVVAKYSVELWDSGNCKKAVMIRSRYYPIIYLEELRKTTKHLNQVSRCPGRDSSTAPSEYESTRSLSALLFAIVSTQSPHSTQLEQNKMHKVFTMAVVCSEKLVNTRVCTWLLSDMCDPCCQSLQYRYS
jgi:hypothetical protein